MGERRKIARLLEQYVAAYRAGDSVGCAAVFTEHGELRSPFGPAAVGREAIAQLHAEWTAEDSADKSIELLSSEVSDDMAWCLAAFREGDATGEGESLCVLDRQADGSWLIRMCSLTP